MMYGQEGPSVTRPPTPEEQTLWRRVVKDRDKGRQQIKRTLYAADLLMFVNNWLEARIPTYKTPYPNSTLVSDVNRVLDNWNGIETCTAKVETADWGVFKRPDGDLDIILPKGVKSAPLPETWTKAPPGLKGLGVAPLLLPVIVILGRVLIAAAIAFIAWVLADAYTVETKARVTLNQVDADMSKQSPEVQAAYQQLRASNPYKEKKGLLESLQDAAMGIGVIALAGLAIFAFSGMKKRSEAAN